jgi:hypothetical protein
MMPLAPIGIDPIMWANNQALILSLLLALQALQQSAPTPAPAPPQPKEGNAKALTTFSGEDHMKLRNFLFECNLIFNMKHCTYATEKSCILYAIQHLDGMAKRHFHCYIELGSTDPKVTWWASFINELESMFGDPDCIGRASDKILGLMMKETSHVHHYMVLFKELADELGWPDAVLHQLYYNGLPNRIKDLWARSDLPPIFNNLIHKAQRTDNHYWKRVDEKKKSEATQTCTSDPKPQSKASTSNAQRSKSKSTSNTQSRSSAPAQSSSSSSSRTALTPTANTKDLSKILGPDGKLLPEEKAHHEKLGLCTYCAEKHTTENCPSKPASSMLKESSANKSASPSKSTSNLSSSSKPKGQVVQVIDPVAEESDTRDTADEDF